jgi:hypothetical protein
MRLALAEPSVPDLVLASWYLASPVARYAYWDHISCNSTRTLIQVTRVKALQYFRPQEIVAIRDVEPGLLVKRSLA